MPSAKILEKKQAQVKELSDKLKSSKMIFFIDYKGISVEEDRNIRKAFREAGSKCEVIKNSIIRLAAKDAKIEVLDSVFEGSTAVVFSDDYMSGPKIANDFAKGREFYKFKGGVMDGIIIDGNKLMKLANLPSKEVLLTKLATVLLANIRNLAVVLDQVSKKTEA